ncbi:MAG: hypothetical protein M3Y42_14550 [Actinomycetota bacterium]|nr:hypothetical protein [Actinomycetota bacterium]MDQ2958170.1 hypothetical protein [Actinomycetota bacterium]
MTSWPSPISDGEWIEPDGSWWVLRPWYKLTNRKLGRLILDPGIRVVEFSDQEREIPVTERADFLTAIAAECAPHRAGDFRDQHRNRLIILERSC